MTSSPIFRRVTPKPSFPEIEARVLSDWKSDGTFHRSLRSREGKDEFVFYDGPPFPTGNPHHGTLFVSVLKDVIGRYKTMRGYYVPRAWGWDCHGLPIETQAEKNLGITDKSQIETTIGVKRFNEECRRIVAGHNANWKTYVDKIGRWVEFDKPYNTLDLSFMESVVWAFAEAHRKGLIYKDYRVTPYCTRCETPLSVSDTRLDDSTRPRQDRAVTVKFACRELSDTYFLAWTTTPWTLPSNLALAVGQGIPYVVVPVGGEKLILAESCLGRYKKEFGEVEPIERMTGAEIVAKGLSYEPLFSYAENRRSEGAFRVLVADFVATEEGTGIVHMAPAFGEDDYWACRKNGITVFAPVDDKGYYSAEVTDFAGQHVLEANPGIIKLLKGRNLVVRDETIEHNYPHCWRCRNALIYRAVDAWYLSVETIKERMLKNNESIEWHPETVKHGRFGKWLENARDWNISRNRFWATPIPVWECDSCDSIDVLGSVAEIQAKADFPITDLHKEYLDLVVYPCGCGGTKRRTPEVLDGWFESGSMPYGQYHYPFEHEQHFRDHFPADFIVEYTGQIRGWFYMLHVLSTALFDRPAFRHCLVHGTLLSAEGKKISKSQKNYTDPILLIERYGADALRAYLLSSAAVQLNDLWFRDDGVEGMLKSITLPLWNALHFFTTYAEIDQITREVIASVKLDPASLGELDRFILAESEALRAQVTAAMDAYDLQTAMRLFPPFLDALNNWYIRRSRERVWGSDARDEKKLQFYATLHTALSTFTRLLAPLCPFTSEEVWRGLGETDSIHLSDWPEANEQFSDDGLRERLNFVRLVISAGLSIRAREKIRVRQPLKRARLAVTASVDVGPYQNLIAEELNVKGIEFVQEPREIAERFARANSKAIGKKFGKKTQSIIEALKQGTFTALPGGAVEVDGERLEPDEFEFTYIAKDGLAVESTDGAVVALDLEITPELELEGRARDLIRLIQEARKDADLNVSDRLRLSIRGAEDVVAGFREHLMRETLTVELVPELTDPRYETVADLGDEKVAISFRTVT